MRKEIWKRIGIAGFYDHYSVSTNGRIRSLGFDYIASNGRPCRAFPRILKTHFNKRLGYEYIVIRNNKTPRTFSLHRLVAITFLPNPNNLGDVNHKDGNKINNNVKNLEWCTRSENLIHRYRVLKQPHNRKGLLNTKGSRPVIQISPTTLSEVALYPSMAEAKRITGIPITSICGSIRGRQKTAGGYYWKYDKSA